MEILKKGKAAMFVVVMIVIGIFLSGRYGWKLGGFRACQSAGISSVTAEENTVHIIGFNPGSFPEGFCGYYAVQQDDRLYVGFRFNAVFGFFETGDFDVTIPVEGEISEVIVKTRTDERTVWKKMEQYGVYIPTECNGVYSVSMVSECCRKEAAYSHAVESGEYIFMDNDIMTVSKDAGQPVPFVITGNIVASREFCFDAEMKKMYLTVQIDGNIVEDQA